MPILNNVRVLNALQIWASPDGQRKIFDVTLATEDNKTITVKSYSEKLQGGWNGDLETYEKPNRQGGMDTFVKQVPKADTGFTPFSGSKGGGGRAPADPFTMYLSYAKDLAVALIAQGILPDDDNDGKIFDKLFINALKQVGNGGELLFERRPDAPKPDMQQEITPKNVDTVYNNVPDDGIRLEDIPF